MKYHYYKLLSGIILMQVINCAISQIEAPECPQPWIHASSKCYFFSSNTLAWLDAQHACEKFGAALISVNGDIEHNLIQTYLSENARSIEERNLWYTGGRIVSGPRNNPTFQWLDGSGLGSTVFWTNPAAPITDTGDYITYMYSDVYEHQLNPGYYWVRRDGSDYFRYICEVSVADTGILISKKRDFDFGVEHSSKVKRGPYFKREPENTVYDIDDDARDSETSIKSASFYSDAGGYPYPQYTWYGGFTTEPISPVTSDDITISNGHLTIHKPSSDKHGNKFYCKASNDLGTVLSEPVSIEFRVLLEFPKTDPSPIQALAWDSTVIECKHNNPANSRIVFDWFLNNNRGDFVSSRYNNHVFISSNGGLYFGHVTTTDSGVYKCAIRLSGGSEERISPPYQLIVITSGGFQQNGPTIHSHFPLAYPKQPKRGDTVYLECFARFSSPTGESPVYHWTRDNNRDLPLGHSLEDYNRRLIIPSVELGDEGVYRCLTSWRSKSDNKTVTLAIEAKPYFGEGALEDQHLDQGTKLIWTCRAFGKPTPTYRWLKNGLDFDERHLPPGSGARITFSNNYQTVTFTSVDKVKDSGMYQCAAINYIGTTYSTAQLRILEFATPSFSRHPLLGEIIATEGTNATIPCDPEGVPAVEISWLKDGKPLALEVDGQSQRRLLPNGYLYLAQVTASIDSGEYTCVATNTLETTGESKSANATISLGIVRRSRLSFGPVDQTVLLHSRVTLDCRADYDYLLDLVYLWYHNNRLLDFEDWKMASIYERGIGVNRGDLIIKNITYEERGQYKCVGQTKSDFAQLSAIVTVVGPPGEPAGLTARNPGKHTVSLSWNKGAENGKSIFAYIIEKYNTDTQLWLFAFNASADGDSGNTTVGNLFASTGYKFRVSAQNEYGVGVSSKESSIIQTDPDKPSSSPRNIRSGGGKEGTLVIQWDLLPKEEWNAPDVTYVAQYREWREDIPDSQGGWLNCTRILFDTIPWIASGRCVVTVGKAKFFTKYSIRVLAKNSLGEGPVSAAVVGMSAVAVPQLTPQNIVAQPYNSTAIMVYWDPIPDDKNVHGGELLGFHLQYWLKDTPTTYGRRNTIYGNATRGLIIGLQPNTDYDVTAQIMNSAGDGNPGFTMRQTTWKKAPQNMPEYVTLNLTSNNGIGVHFRGIVTDPDEEPLDGYKVRIWRAGKSVRSAADYDCGRRTEIILDDFIREDEQGALYNLRVFGYSRGGVGKMSSPLIQFVKGCNGQRSNPETTWVYLCDSCSHSVSYALLCAVTAIHLLKANL